MLVEELADPRLDYLLGEPAVLPLPDASVDLLVGADPADPEVVRVLRHAGGRVLPAGPRPDEDAARRRRTFTHRHEKPGTPPARFAAYAVCRGPRAPHGGVRLP